MTPIYNRRIEELYLKMYNRLFIFADNALKNPALAEEAVQETFRIACMKPESLCNSPNPEGWLVNTMKNVICNIRRERASMDRVLSAYIFSKAKELSASEDQLDFSLLYQNIAGMEEYKLLKEMVLDGKSHLEMAKARGISVEACKKRVQRAKEKLKKKILD